MKFAYGYPDFPDADTHIDALNLPLECSNALKRVGVEYIGDVLDIFARLPDSGPWMNVRCYVILFCAILQYENCPWRDDIEDWLVTRVEPNTD